MSEMHIELARAVLMRQGLARVLYRRFGRALRVRIVQSDKELYPTDSLRFGLVEAELNSQACVGSFSSLGFGNQL